MIAPSGVNARRASQAARQPQASGAQEREGRRWPVGFGVKLALIAGCAAAVIGLGVGLWQAGEWLEGFMRRAPVFALSDIRVEGCERLSEATVVQAGGVALGQNLFAIDGAVVEEAVLQHPWIRKAQARRRLPNGLDIIIEERTPLAYLVVQGLPQLMADDGALLAGFSLDERFDIPFVTGAPDGLFELDSGLEDPSAEPRADSRGAAERTGTTSLVAAGTSPLAASGRASGSAVPLQEARQAFADRLAALLADYARVGLRRSTPLQEIHIHGHSVRLLVSDPPVQVELGEPPYLDKLRRFKRVQSAASKDMGALRTVRLDNRRHPARVALTLN